jgi:Tol biopolymer transport system component
MKLRLHQRASWVGTLGLLLLLVLGGVPPTLSASRSAGPASGWVALISVGLDRTSADGWSKAPSISALGRYVAFQSTATNLVENDTDDHMDVFVCDRQTGEMTRVSVASDGTQGNGWSSSPSITAWARYVAFQSDATNLVAGDVNGQQDVFVHDRQTGQTTLVSVTSDGVQGDALSSDASLSALGGYVAFYSHAANLVADDSNDEMDVFVHDMETGETTRVSVASDGAQSDGGSYSPSISALGRYVAFESRATNLVESDTNDQTDVFVHDRQTGQTTRVSVASDGAQGDFGSHFPSISQLGRYVAFESHATNLVSGDTNSRHDVFVHDRETGETTRVSVASDGTQGDSASYRPSISAGGRYVAFYSHATNLVASDDNGASDVFVHDRQTGETRRVSLISDGTQGDGGSYAPSISAFGDYVAFDSDATNLVQGDTNNLKDVFLHGPWSRVYLPLVSSNQWQLSILLGAQNVEQGLYLHPGPDADTLPVVAGNPPLDGRRTGNGLAVDLPGDNEVPDNYMQFDAGDGTIYQAPSGTRLAIVVTYLDEGTDTFSVEYDAHSGGPFSDGRFRDTGSVTKTGSGEWRVHTFILDDAYFANRDNGADFHIDDHGDGAEVIHRVTVHP